MYLKLRKKEISEPLYEAIGIVKDLLSKSNIGGEEDEGKEHKMEDEVKEDVLC